MSLRESCPSLWASIAFPVIKVPRALMAFRTTLPIDEIEPYRRRGYLRMMFSSPRFRKWSHRRKVSFRRRLLACEVAAV